MTIQEAPVPKNAQELKSFLGLFHYYGRFIPNLATLLHPLNQVLKLNSKWKWLSKCQNAFQFAKNQLIPAKVLAYYNLSLPLQLAADASAYGIGTVISHVYPDGTERPIAYASRTLSISEKNHAQLALLLVFGLQNFIHFCMGVNSHFTQTTNL